MYLPELKTAMETIDEVYSDIEDLSRDSKDFYDRCQDPEARAEITKEELIEALGKFHKRLDVIYWGIGDGYSCLEEVASLVGELPNPDEE